MDTELKKNWLERGWEKFWDAQFPLPAVVALFAVTAVLYYSAIQRGARLASDLAQAQARLDEFYEPARASLDPSEKEVVEVAPGIFLKAVRGKPYDHTYLVGKMREGLRPNICGLYIEVTDGVSPGMIQESKGEFICPEPRWDH